MRTFVPNLGGKRRSAASDSDGGSEATDPSESSDGGSDDSDVKAVLAHPGVVVPEDDAGSHDEADALIDPFIDAHPAPVAVPVAAIPFVAPPDPVVDALVIAAPAWGVGVECAEVNNHGKTKCLICEAPIIKGHVRLKYYQSKSAIKYLHVTCCDRIPVARSLHSRACLRFQRDYGLGAHGDVVRITEGIDASLALLP